MWMAEDKAHRKRLRKISKKNKKMKSVGRENCSLGSSCRRYARDEALRDAVFIFLFSFFFVENENFFFSFPTSNVEMLLMNFVPVTKSEITRLPSEWVAMQNEREKRIGERKDKPEMKKIKKITEVKKWIGAQIIIIISKREGKWKQTNEIIKRNVHTDLQLLSTHYILNSLSSSFVCDLFKFFSFCFSHAMQIQTENIWKRQKKNANMPNGTLNKLGKKDRWALFFSIYTYL